MTRPEWLDEPRIQAAIAKLVEEAPPLSADQLDLLRRTGFFDTRATAGTDSSPSSSDDVGTAS